MAETGRAWDDALDRGSLERQAADAAGRQGSVDVVREATGRILECSMITDLEKRWTA